mmetsp:Transcript_76826/g.205250  ORF Transcript_76826/g.205250 Transcript_76826/m.205250 type:complete len:82 (-) Transcript_76826:366-611(-)
MAEPLAVKAFRELYEDEFQRCEELEGILASKDYEEVCACCIRWTSWRLQRYRRLGDWKPTVMWRERDLQSHCAWYASLLLY